MLSMINISGDFYVGWFTLAMINACLAQIKNNAYGGGGQARGKTLGGFAWFLISLFLGPVATLFILVFKH